MGPSRPAGGPSLFGQLTDGTPARRPFGQTLKRRFLIHVASPTYIVRGCVDVLAQGFDTLYVETDALRSDEETNFGGSRCVAH